MAQYVRLPDNSLFEVREGESPHQAFLKAQQQYPDLFPERASGKKPEGGFGAAFSAGLSRLGGEAALTAGKLGLLTPEEAEARYKRQLEKARGIFKPTEEGWTEAPLRKLAETAGGSAAYMLAPAAAGVAALAAPVVVPGAAAALGTGVIGAGLAGLTGFGQYTGSNLAAQMEEGKKGLAETSGAAAAAAAVPQAALDVLSFRMIPGVKRLFGSVGKEITEDQAKALASQTLRQKIGDYTAATGLAMGVEGATEVAQDMLEKLQAGASLSDPKAREDYLENFIGGAALAGVLGPFGRGFERAGIQARGRQLEKERLDAEARAAADEAAALKLTAPEEALGPEVPAALQTKRLQDRLAQIEQEAAVARQDKDMDTLLRLQRERMELEAQVGAQPTGMEARRQLELAQQSLIERIKATPTPEEKRPLLNELVQVQKQLAEIKKLDATPAAASYDDLLRQEKNILGQLQKTEGDANTQLKLLDKLKNVQERLTQGEMFTKADLSAVGDTNKAAQEFFEKRRERRLAEEKAAADAAAAEAAEKKRQEDEAAAAERLAKVSDVWKDFGAFQTAAGAGAPSTIQLPVPPSTPQDYQQGTLFGPAERVAVPAQTEMRLPQLQQAVSTLTERPDLSKKDRSLLERVRDLVMPKTAVPETDEKGFLVAPQPNKEAVAAQARLSAVNEKAQSVAVALDKEKGKIANNEIGLRKLQQQATEINTNGLQLEEQIRVAKADVEQRKAAEKAAASAEEAAKLRKERDAKEKELAQLTSKALINNSQAQEVNARIQALTKRSAQENKQAQRQIDKLERLSARLTTEKTQATEQVEAKPAKEIPLNLLTQPLQIRDAEGNIKTEAAPIQLMADFVRDLSKTRPDTTQSRAALENFFTQLGQVQTRDTAADLFAGTEAARATEFSTPEQFQEFMGSAEMRSAEAQRGLAEAQKAGPPTPEAVRRYDRLMKPSVAILKKETSKLQGLLKALGARLADYKATVQKNLEANDIAVLKAKKKLQEVLLYIEQSVLNLHVENLEVRKKAKEAEETYAGLEDFYNKYTEALDIAVKRNAEWSSLKAKEQAQFQKTLETKQETLRMALGRLAVLRGEIRNQFGEALAMEVRIAGDASAGALLNPELFNEYQNAKKSAQKAADDFYGFVRTKQKIDIPKEWRVSKADLQNFLVQQAELAEMLFQQGLVIKKWKYTADEVEDKMTAAKAETAADPFTKYVLDNARKGLDKALSAQIFYTAEKPTELIADINRLGREIRALNAQITAPETQRAEQARREQRVAEARERTEKEQKTRAEIRAENERLEREGEAKTRVTFEKQSKKEREALAELQTRLDGLVEAKRDAMDKKRAQTKHFRLTPEEQKSIASGKKTREQVIDAKREADLKKIAAEFDTVIAKVQAEIRAIRGVAKPSEKREAQLKSTLEMQRRIGEEGPLETAEEVERIAQRQPQGRTGQTLVNVRTGRVSEGKLAKPTREMTEGQERVEAAEANRLAAAQQAANEEKYRNGLVQYAKTAFDADLSSLDTDALEYEILKLQAEAEERASLRRPATEKEKAKIAKDVAEGLDNPLNRIISHDYASRENTPLDDKTADAVNKGNLTQALTSLAKNGSTPFVRMVAQRLLPMVENTKLTTESLAGKGGEYDAQTDTVTLNKDALTEEDLIHEPVHAATIGVIDAKPDTLTKDQLAARTALEKLYAKMQARPEFKDEYGNVSFKEFVSELLSNKQVRDKINQTAGLLRRIYEGFLRMLGIEPTTLSDKAVEQAFAMFSPSTANVGKEERLASIMRGVFPGTASAFSDKVPKSITDMVNRTIARNATLGDKIVANLSGLRLRTFIADQWAPVDALRKMGVAAGKIKEAQSMQMQVYMRLFSNMQEYTNAALINGVPELRKDEAGIRTIEGGDAKANGATIATALKKASVLGNQQAVERTFTYWMASLRAKQDGVGFEKLNFNLTPEEMAELKQSLVDLETFFKANPTVKDAFEEARQLYRQHNRRLLDLQVQTKVMSKEVADDLAKGDYIGFYRVDDNGVVELMLGGSRPVRVGNIIDQPYLKELVGGDQHILPFFAGMAQNTALLMSMALKNMQHTNTAYMFQDLGLGKIRSVPEGKEVPLGQLRFKQDGKDYWFDADKAAFGKMDVPFDLVMQGLQGVKTAIPALVKAMAVPANILRKAVRRIPTYTLRQTVRDPVHGWMTTGGNFVPVLSTWRELYKGMTNPSQTQIALKEAALISNNVYSGDSEGVTKMLRDLSAEPSKFSQIMMKLDEFAMQGEAATRAVLYDDFRKREMSHVEAMLNTVEVMNTSRRGTSASLHWLSHLTPFFNAQIQGLDAVYRALKGDTTFEAKLNARNALLKRGAMLAGVTMAYALMMEDDEAYKNATPEERYGNWFVRVPGTDKTVRVPIPFELGLIFKSIPEAFINVAYGDKKASEAVKALAKQAYMSSPFGIPTAVKGPLEVAFNYNMYTDQPVETTREQAMDVDQRYRESTTELAKLLGKLGVLSPVQIDHLVRSYTGSAGIMLLSTANMALRPMSGRADVEKPDMSLTEIPVVGTVFQPTTGRGMVNAAFDDVARYQRAAMTYKNLAASDPEAAREYADKFGREIALASMGGSFRQQMGEFAAYKRAIASNPNLTGAQKREQIDAIKKQEIEFAQRLRKLAA